MSFIAHLLVIIASQFVSLAMSEVTFHQVGDSLILETRNNGTFLVNDIDMIHTLFILESHLNTLNATLSAQSSDLSSAKATIESQNQRIAALEASQVGTQASINQIQVDVARNQSIFLASASLLQGNLSVINSTLSTRIDSCLLSQTSLGVNISVDHQTVGSLLNLPCQPYEFEVASPTSTSARVCQIPFWTVTLDGQLFNFPVGEEGTSHFGTSYSAIAGSVKALTNFLNINGNTLLNTISFPYLSYLGSSVEIYNNYVLTAISMPSLSVVASLSIQGNGILTSIFLPNLTYVNQISIYNNVMMTAISMPSLSYVGSNVQIYGSAILSFVNMLDLSYVGAALQIHEIGVLTSLTLPNLSFVGILYVINNFMLTYISIPSITYVGYSIRIFSNDPSLTVLPSDLFSTCHSPQTYCINTNPNGNTTCSATTCPP